MRQTTPDDNLPKYRRFPWLYHSRFMAILKWLGLNSLVVGLIAASSKNLGLVIVAFLLLNLAWLATKFVDHKPKAAE